MALTRWNPFKELDDIMNQYHRISRPSNGSQEAMTTADWTPMVDISEKETEYLIKAELAGIKKEDIKVNIDKGVLTLKGERKSEHEEEDEKFHRVERFYGSFARSFSLPENVDEGAIKAEYKDGMLNLHLPKKALEQPKSVEVQVH